MKIVLCLTILFILSCFLVFFDEIWEKNSPKLLKILGFIRPREELMSSITALLSGSSANLGGVSTGLADIPRYKFYTEIYHRIISNSVKWGSPYSKAMRELRLVLIKDDHFEKHKSALVKDSFSHFIFMMAITWGFVILSQKLLEISIQKSVYYHILALQGAGVSVFGIFYFSYSKKIFGPYSKAFEVLYGLHSLLPAGISISQIKQQLPLYEWLEVEDKKEFKVIKKSLKHLLQLNLQKGASLSGRVKEYVEELSFLMDLDLKKFLKKLNIIKFGVLIFFFFPSYLYFLFRLFGSLSIL